MPALRASDLWSGYLSQGYLILEELLLTSRVEAAYVARYDP
ncbi:unnamed protein product [marine sediment metagenome]|uniref:Uncharacterized protein n=1 Tax=marine sediment metagenome TaxID=412755 RepID=X1UDB2_9ZZZZ